MYWLIDPEAVQVEGTLSSQVIENDKGFFFFFTKCDL